MEYCGYQGGGSKEHGGLVSVWCALLYNGRVSIVKYPQTIQDTTLHCAVYTYHCSVYIIQFCVQCTIYSGRRTVNSVQPGACPVLEFMT